MKIKSSHNCPFHPDIDQGMADGLSWIARVLESIRKAGPTHKNYENAKNAAWALNELGRFCEQVDQVGHDLAEALAEATDATAARDHTGFDFAEYKMAMQEKGDA